MISRAWILLLAITAPMAATAVEGGRWYTPAQVAQGEAVFEQHCASCHGKNAEATPDWRTPEPDGKYPPPPLNGTAHAWHHPFKALRQVIREGGARVGGKMPPFKDTLTASEIDAAIAYFQSLWPDDIYAAWQKRGSGLQPVNKPEKAGNPITRHLEQRLKDVEIAGPTATPVAGMHQVRVRNRYLYLTADGRYAFMGDLVDLKTGENLTTRERAQFTLESMSDFPESNMVIYPATVDSRAELTVFTDTSCPYCRKLHAEVPQLQAAGVTVRYIPYPRGGRAGDGYADLKSVWCAQDSLTAMDIAKGRKKGQLPAGDCAQASAVDAGHALGERIGIQGTPALILPDGSRIDGYMPVGRLLQVLGLSTSTTSR